MNIPITCVSSLLWRYYWASKQLSASNYLLIAPEMTELHLCDSKAPGWSHKNACQLTPCPTDRLVAADWVDQMFWHHGTQTWKSILDGVVMWYESQWPRALGEVCLVFLFFFFFMSLNFTFLNSSLQFKTIFFLPVEGRRLVVTFLNTHWSSYIFENSFLCPGHSQDVAYREHLPATQLEGRTRWFSSPASPFFDLHLTLMSGVDKRWNKFKRPERGCPGNALQPCSGPLALTESSPKACGELSPGPWVLLLLLQDRPGPRRPTGA